MLDVVEKRDDAFSSPAGVAALPRFVPSHLIYQGLVEHFCSRFIFAQVFSCFPPVPDSYLSFATLQLVEDGARLLSINLSVRQDGPSVKAGRLWRFRFPLRPPASWVSGLKGLKIIRQKTGQECYGYSIKCCRGEKNKAQHMWVMLLQENNLVFVLQEYKLVQVTT